MTIRSCIALLAGLGLTAGSLRSAEEVRGLDPEQFKRVQALVKPSEDELRWEKIPWRVSLWEARKDAAAQGRPILLWEMDGNPLGCT
jgi:hypothetical protein